MHVNLLLTHRLLDTEGTYMSAAIGVHNTASVTGRGCLITVFFI